MDGVTGSCFFFIIPDKGPFCQWKNEALAHQILFFGGSGGKPSFPGKKCSKLPASHLRAEAVETERELSFSMEKVNLFPENDQLAALIKGAAYGTMLLTENLERSLKNMKPDRDFAWKLFREYNESESLVHHGLAVEGVMRHFAVLFREDPDKWGVIGLLHDLEL